MVWACRTRASMSRGLRSTGNSSGFSGLAWPVIMSTAVDARWPGLARLPQHLRRAAIGQAEVRDHEVVAPLGQPGQPLVGADGGFHLPALAPEGDRDEVENVAGILDHEDAGAGERGAARMA